jgi:hypothetical protein
MPKLLDIDVIEALLQAHLEAVNEMLRAENQFTRDELERLRRDLLAYEQHHEIESNEARTSTQ